MYEFNNELHVTPDANNTDKYGKFVIEPLERGYGITIGNALRRIMLSSLTGAAISAIKIEGVSHEFSAIDFVKEDVTEIVMNIKSIRVKDTSDEEDKLANPVKKAVLDFHGEGVVTAADILLPPNVEIVNKDQVIATLSGGKNCHLTMSLDITNGRGYVGASKDDSLPIGTIAVDALYTPVTRVNSIVEDTRVGQSTDYNKLTMEVWTDGTMEPKDAIAKAARVLNAHLDVLMDKLNASVKNEVIMTSTEEDEVLTEKDMPIGDLQLKPRACNCLQRCGIHTLQELCSLTEAQLFEIRGLGKDTFQDIMDKVHEQGCKLKSEK